MIATRLSYPTITRFSFDGQKTGAEFIRGWGAKPSMSQDESKMLCENTKGYAIDA